MRFIWAAALLAILALVILNYRPPTPVGTSSHPSPAPSPPATTLNSTGLQLTLPPGFSISLAWENLDRPRDLEWGSANHLLVSLPYRGQVFDLTAQKTLLSGLNRPHGLVYHAGKLYVAETDKVTVDGQKILALPSGGNHWTRSLLIADSRLYVSIGSSCNVCRESDPRRAAIYVANLDGSDFTPFATGLRNSVFLTHHSGQIWATDMGRDWLGNNLPPDEINIIRDQANYGWPTCYGQNILDTTFSPQGRCNAATPATVDLPAHSAPLGLAFVPDSWPKEFREKLLVALHGSWNRNPPDGYKIVLIDVSTGQISDFITGWLQNGTALGRPVDLLFDPSGRLFITDDKRGVVYQIMPPAN